MSKPTSPTYKTTNWTDHNATLKRRRSLTSWFDPEMGWDAKPSGKRGRSLTFSDAAIQTCLTMTVLFGMALHQTTAFVESLLRLASPGTTLCASKYLGRALWRNGCGYHCRSRVETKMPCAKLPGQRLMARDFDRQVAEVQVRIAILNGYTALGIPVTTAVGKSIWGKGISVCQLICATD